MSSGSIGKNNQALEYINGAISSYKQAVNTIEKTNNSSQIKNIISMINRDIDELGKIKVKINNINAQIRSAMSDKKNGSESS